MEITDIELHPVATRRRNDVLTFHGILEVGTDAGITGLGEVSDLSHAPAFMPDVEDLQASLNDHLVGADPTNLTDMEATLDGAFPRRGTSKLVHAGVEIACHDIIGKALDISVSEYLGGPTRDRIPICYPIFRMQEMDEVPQQLEYVEMALEHGFDTIRFYFGDNLEADIHFLNRLEGEFGDSVQVKSLDASGRFTWKEALAAYDRLQDFEFQHIESPVPRDDVAGLARVTERIGHPVSEHVGSLQYAMELIDAKAVDIMNTSLSNAGGIRAVRRLHGLAEAAGIECLVGTTQELSIGTAAQAQTAAVAECPIRHSDPVGPFLYQNDVVADRVRYEDGSLLVPDGPGLGMELDRGQLDEHRQPLSSTAE